MHLRGRNAAVRETSLDVMTTGRAEISVSVTGIQEKDRDVHVRKILRKRMTNKQSYLLVMAVLMALPSCSRPVSSEQFVRNASRDAYGRYVFDVDMQDSLSCYDISLISAFLRERTKD